MQARRPDRDPVPRRHVGLGRHKVDADAVTAHPSVRKVKNANRNPRDDCHREMGLQTSIFPGLSDTQSFRDPCSA